MPPACVKALVLLLLATLVSVPVLPLLVAQEPAGEPPLIQSPLPVEPETPQELFRAVMLMVELGRPEVARVYLTQFLAGDPTEELLLELRDAYGPAAFLKLANIRDLRPHSTRLLEMSNRALTQFANDPARINQLIADLGGTSEEQVVAVTELRALGQAVVPPLIRALGDPTHATHRDTIIYALIRVGQEAAAPLIGALDAPDPGVRAGVIQALGWIGARDAVPHLWYAATSPGEEPGVKRAAQAAIARLVGVEPGQRAIPTTGVVSRLTRSAQEHFQLKSPWKVGADGLVSYWDWSPEQETVAELRLTPTAASSRQGLEFARQALALAPSRPEVQVTYLSVALAAEARSAGWDNPWPTGPGTAHDLALTLGPQLVSQVVLNSLDANQPASAIAGINVLGQIGGAAQLSSRLNERSPLLVGLNYPDRRVQFAAATAVLKLDPEQRFAGADRVVAILARALADAGDANRHVLVVDAAVDRGTKLVGLLGELGFTADIHQTGREAFTAAAERPDVEFILLNANVIRWPLTETLANLRADARTAGIPIVIYSDERTRADVQRHADTYRLVTTIIEPELSADLDRQIAPFLDGLRSPPASPLQRKAQAESAAYWFAHLAQGQRSRLFPIEKAERELFAALENPDLSQNVLIALGAIKSRKSQQQLADVALDARRDVLLREIAALQLAYHIQRHGLLISNDSIAGLHQAWMSVSDPDLHTALSGVIGTLDPSSDLVGTRLREFRPVPAQ